MFVNGIAGESCWRREWHVKDVCEEKGGEGLVACQDVCEGNCMSKGLMMTEDPALTELRKRP